MLKILGILTIIWVVSAIVGAALAVLISLTVNLVYDKYEQFINSRK